MEYRSLGRSGPKVSAIGLGAWQWGSRRYWRPEQVLSNIGGSGWSFEERELEDLDRAHARFMA